MAKNGLGIAVIGSGRIGTLRARLAGMHPSVKFLAVSDVDPNKAEALAKLSGAHFHTSDNNAAIDHPDVDAVFVSTPEQEHAEPIKRALLAGKPVLCEKPIGLTLQTADDILDMLAKTNGKLNFGYSRRYKECFLRAKEQMVQGRLGTVISGLARVYNSRAQTFQILKRDPHATPVLDVLTY